MKEVEEIRGQQETYDTTLTRFVYSPLSWLQLRNSLLMDFKDVELITLEKRKLDVWWNSMLKIPLIMVVYGNGYKMIKYKQQTEFV